jgi:hypothetical protein
MTRTGSVTPTPAATQTPTSTVTPTPTNTGTPSPTPTRTITPTLSLTPTATGTRTPTPTPSKTPTQSIAVSPASNYSMTAGLIAAPDVAGFSPLAGSITPQFFKVDYRITEIACYYNSTLNVRTLRMTLRWSSSLLANTFSTLSFVDNLGVTRTYTSASATFTPTQTSPGIWDNRWSWDVSPLTLFTAGNIYAILLQ